MMAAFGMVAADPSASECAVSYWNLSIMAQLCKLIILRL
jgi:hypothetical protein